ncbi:methyltransferase domain-containing protein [Solibacillus sp. CAU 1738]|uniref:O-methyltransferase n=1 Tax=Solibacillus sp. CAU 1738 TaxID=3140363 RepID=UPI003261994A
MNTTYRSNTFVPNIVFECKKLAEDYDFKDSCSDEVGRLLSVLVGQVKQGKILEVGTGYGVGSSWIISTIAPSVEFISIDNSEEKIALVSDVIKGPQVEFVCGDWQEIINKGPFQFIFADAAVVKNKEAEMLVSTLGNGGMVLLDDFTPEEHWPEEWKGKPDLTREFWLNHPGLISTEIYLTPKTSAILATKINI